MTVDLMKWVGALSGLIATAAAALVLASLTGEVASADDHKVASSEVTTASTVSATAVVVAKTPVEPIAGIDPAVSEALTASGYTEFMKTTDLAPLLPSSVISVLEEAGAVLVIPAHGDSDAR